MFNEGTQFDLEPFSLFLLLQLRWSHKRVLPLLRPALRKVKDLVTQTTGSKKTMILGGEQSGSGLVRSNKSRVPKYGGRMSLMSISRFLPNAEWALWDRVSGAQAGWCFFWEVEIWNWTEVWLRAQRKLKGSSTSNAGQRDLFTVVTSRSVTIRTSWETLHGGALQDGWSDWLGDFPDF